ncbi:MAG: DUF1295 domain-containing protein [Ginsengibacter sp.]
MDLYSQESKSIPQKVIIHLLEIFFLWLSWWILFGEGGDFIQNKLHIHNATASIERREIIFVFNIVIFLRLAFMMFFLLKRKIPWEESVSVPFAFALYYIGYAMLVLPTNRSIDWIDYGAIILFIIGCTLNTGGEILRNHWKKNLENKGKIYTKGFFKYSMHINYFGDLLWVIGYAVITRNGWSVAIPVFLFCFFAFYNIPMLDKHLHEKYGDGFEAYAKYTKKLIPFIY